MNIISPLSTSGHDVRGEDLARNLAWERAQLPVGYGKQWTSYNTKIEINLIFLPFLTHFLLNKGLKSRKVYYFARQNQHFNFNCRGSLIWKSRQLTKVTCSCLKYAHVWNFLLMCIKNKFFIIKSLFDQQQLQAINWLPVK